MMRQKKIAGMVHVMLPDSSLGKSDRINVAKFADTGIYALMELLKGGRCQTDVFEGENCGWFTNVSIRFKRYDSHWSAKC